MKKKNDLRLNHDLSLTFQTINSNDFFRIMENLNLERLMLVTMNILKMYFENVYVKLHLSNWFLNNQFGW